MAGHFELIDAPGGGYQVQLFDDSGKVVAVSVKYHSKKAAAAGVFKTREIAASGLIRDRSRERVHDDPVPNSDEDTSFK
jgi:uncharacterized protein YegP (UPF0339 family)